MLALLDKALLLLGLVLGFLARDKSMREQAEYQDKTERIEDDPAAAMRDHFNRPEDRK